MSHIENGDFIPLGEFIEEMSSVDSTIYESFLDTEITMTVEKVQTESPCQLLIEIKDNNEIRIGAIPPMYYVETTFMPIFHQIKLTIEKQ